MISMICTSQPTWADVCLGFSSPWPSYAGASGLSPLSVTLGGAMPRPGGGDAGSARLQRQQIQAQERLGSLSKQRVQDEQETNVFGHKIEAMNVFAPATAHVGVTVKGGELGPYPWRRPV
ncbi:hypothetical protein [Spirillospora sp. NPDC047279]|uniref:hypothetical protein n=1 Tax=Spirillospora sp. NPDC047279 TaxID=3155478 RepID=UPI00340F8F04